MPTASSLSGQHHRQPRLVRNLDQDNEMRFTLEPRRREGSSGTHGVLGHEVHDRARSVPMRGRGQHFGAAGRRDGHQPGEKRRLIAGANGYLNLSSGSRHNASFSLVVRLSDRLLN